MGNELNNGTAKSVWAEFSCAAECDEYEDDCEDDCEDEDEDKYKDKYEDLYEYEDDCKACAE